MAKETKNNSNGLVDIVAAIGTFLTTLAVYIYKSHAKKR